MRDESRRGHVPRPRETGGLGRILRLATVVALILAFAPAHARAVYVPRGQEPLLMTMLGHRAALPGGCRFADGTNADVIAAEYACDSGRVVVHLLDPDDAPPDALRTRYFAVVVESGPAPPGLTDALADLIRAHEGELRFRPLIPPALRGLLAGGVAIALLVFAVQVVMHRRLPGTSAVGRSVPDDVSAPWLLVGAAVVGAYLLSRMLFLDRLPVFVDEAVHIQWAKSAMGSDTEILVQVGKWLPIQWMTLFVHLPLAPLAAARVASVSMGLATLAACVMIGRELFSFRVGILAAAVYTMVPFALLYDRLALADVYVSAFAAWATFVAIAMRRHTGLGWALALSACTFGATLAKPSGAMVLAIPPLVAALLVGRGERARYVQRVLPSVLGGAVFAGFLLAQGYGTLLVAGQSSLDASGLEMRLLANAQVLRDWFMPLLTPAVVWLAAGGILCAFVPLLRNRREVAFLVALVLLSVVPYAIVSTKWYPRYALFLVVPVSLLVARTVVALAAIMARPLARVSDSAERIAGNVAIAGILLALVVACLPRSLLLITDPPRAVLPFVERSMYIDGTTSGYGLPELAAFLAEQANGASINVVRFSRTPAKEAIGLYLPASASAQIHLLDPPAEPAAEQIEKLADVRRTLLVVDHELNDAAALQAPVRNARQIWSHTRPGGKTRLEVWEMPRA